MVAFVRDHGKLIPFANQQEADAYTGQARQAAVADARHLDEQPDPAATPQAQAPLPGAPGLGPPPFEPAPSPQLAGAPQNVNSIDGKIVMRKGQEFWKFDPAQRQEMLSAGYVEASDADMRTLAEREEAAGSESFLGEVGMQAFTGAESLAKAALSVPAAAESLVTGERVTGGDYLSSLYARFDDGISQEQAKRAIRYRAEERQLMNFVGEAAAYMTGGAAVAKGVAKVAPRVGATLAGAGAAETGLGLGARAGVFAAEGAVTGGLSANEAAWIRDDEFTASDLAASMGMGAIFGAALPVGTTGAKKVAANLKSVFGKKTKKISDAALGGERASFLDDPVAAMVGIKTKGEASRLGFQGLKLDPDRVARSGGIADDVEGAISQDFEDFANIRLNDSKPLMQTGAGGALKTADRAHVRAGEIEDSYLDILGSGEATYDEIVEGLTRRLDPEQRRLLASSDSELAAVMKKNSKRLLPEELRAELDRAGTPIMEDGAQKLGVDGKGLVYPEPDTSSWTVPLDRLQEQKRFLIETAAGAGDGEARGIANLIDTIEDTMGRNADDPIAYAETLAEDKLLRRLRPMLDDVRVKGPGDEPGFAGSLAKWIAGVGVGVIHPLTGPSMQLAAVREAGQIAKARLLQQQIAKRYFQGTAAFEAMGDDAVAALLKRAKGASGKATPWIARKFDVTTATGGYISQSLYRGMMPQLASSFRPDGVEDWQEAYDQRVKELDIVASNFDSVTASVSGRIGPNADTHPNTTMNATMAPVNALMYLQEAIPKQTVATALTPMLKGPPPSTGEITTFSRKWEAVMDPYTMVENFANGKLSPESLDAVNRVYPGFVKKLQESVMSSLGERTEPLDFQVRQQVELLMGAPGSMVKAQDPGFQQRFSQAAMMVQQSAGGSQGGGAPAPGGGKTGRPVGSPTLQQQYMSPVNRAMQNINN